MLRATFEADPTIKIFNRLAEKLEKHLVEREDCSEERNLDVVVTTEYDEEVPTCLRLFSLLFQLPSTFKIHACQ